MVPEGAAPVWHAPAGTIRGRADGPVLRATNIPYARAGRYEPPVPLAAAAGPIEATEWSPACPQLSFEMLDAAAPGNPLGGLEFTEDCQRLSICVPAEVGPEEQLPVMVWVHGGSYVTGAGDQRIYNTRSLVERERVITVNVTYRLGMFGFLGRTEVPGNLGLLDLIEALRWVRRNIAAFGGDPGNVTAWGESSGGDAVAHLMIAEGAEGLFHRAIIQSAPFGLTAGRERMTGELGRLADQLPLNARFERLLAVQRRIEGYALRFGLRGLMPFGVEYGVHPLPPEDRLDAAWSTAARHIDVLLGANEREVALFVPAIPGVRHLHKVTGLGASALEALVRSLSRRVYFRGGEAFLRRHVRARGRAYRYRFLHDLGGTPLAAAHATELPFLFWQERMWRLSPVLIDVSTEQIEVDSARLQRRWADFARTGSPQIGQVPGVVDLQRVT